MIVSVQVVITFTVVSSNPSGPNVKLKTHVGDPRGVHHVELRPVVFIIGAQDEAETNRTQITEEKHLNYLSHASRKYIYI